MGDDPARFYMTYARSRPNELTPWIERHNVPILDNALHRWSEAQDAFLSPFEYDTTHVVDAGGYNVMAEYVTKGGNLSSKYDEKDVQEQLDCADPFYPWTLEEYHSWLSEYSDEFEWATVMDYACEDRFNPLWSIDDRIEATLENTIEQFDMDPDYKLLPVLQGRSVDDYVWFYEQLEDHGIPTDHVGLGTVCRISSEKKIARFEQEIRERTDVERIHGFGVKIQAFQHGATFDSADSQAWVYGPSNGRCVLDEKDRMRNVEMPDDSLARTVESFKNYYTYVTRLQQGEAAVDYESKAVEYDIDTIAREVISNMHA